MANPSLTSRAIVYLKVRIPDEDPEPCILLSETDMPVLRDLGNGLVASYVVDMGSEFKYVQHKHLQEENIGPEDLHAIGLTNLLSLASQNLRVGTHPNGQIFAALMGGNFEASLILLDDLWNAALRQFVKGDYVVTVPAREILAFCDSSSAEGILELRATSQRAKAAGVDHPLTDQLFRRTDQGWLPFHTP